MIIICWQLCDRKYDKFQLGQNNLQCVKTNRKIKPKYDLLTHKMIAFVFNISYTQVVLYVTTLGIHLKYKL